MLFLSYNQLTELFAHSFGKTAYGLGFQHLPRDLANVNAWKTMFDPYNITLALLSNLVTK